MNPFQVNQPLFNHENSSSQETKSYYLNLTFYFTQNRL